MVAAAWSAPIGATRVDESLKPNAVVEVGNVRFGNDLPLALIAGPCQLESRAHALEMASALKEITTQKNNKHDNKTTNKKANRTSASAARGGGLAAALP